MRNASHISRSGRDVDRHRLSSLAPTTPDRGEACGVTQKRKEKPLDRLRKLKAFRFSRTLFPRGHFYSPYPDLKDIDRRKEAIFDRSKRPIPGIDIREERQLNLLAELATHYEELPHLNGDPDLRHELGNIAFSYTDAVVLFCMLRRYGPRRVIEIGSGHSSAMMLDTADAFPGNEIEFTFIEPYPALLRSLAGEETLAKHEVIGSNLSEVDPAVFDQLGAGDILFVDSTHVSKTGSDVNQIFFEILPRLNDGVIIHVHDVFYPFEYPIEWIEETRAWNEDYLLRAFLQDNPRYEILFFNHFMNLHHAAEMTAALPVTAKHHGGSLWLRKVAAPENV